MITGSERLRCAQQHERNTVERNEEKCSRSPQVRERTHGHLHQVQSTQRTSRKRARFAKITTNTHSDHRENRTRLSHWTTACTSEGDFVKLSRLQQLQAQLRERVGWSAATRICARERERIRHAPPPQSTSRRYSRYCDCNGRNYNSFMKRARGVIGHRGHRVS